MLLPGKARGAVAVRRTLATTICRVADPTQVARPRQLRDASTVMRFRPAHQRRINRRHDGRASCFDRQRLKPLLPWEPQIHAPATWKGGHESGLTTLLDTTVNLLDDPIGIRSRGRFGVGALLPRYQLIAGGCPAVRAVPHRTWRRMSEAK